MVLPGPAGTELGLFRVSPRFPDGRGTSQGHQALVAQLDRASASGAEGHRFESCRAHGAGPRGDPWALFYVSGVGVGTFWFEPSPGGAQRSPSCRAYGSSQCLDDEISPVCQELPSRVGACQPLA